MAKLTRSLALLSLLFASLSGAALAATAKVSAPMVCNKGGDQKFEVSVTAPASAAEGSTYTVRIDSFPSGKISQTGLRYLHDMVTEYTVPQGATYVPGSARIVAGTGTENIRQGAFASHSKGVIRMSLPAQIPEGSEYTPPSLEFRLIAASPPPAALVVGFLRHRMKANAIIVGDVQVSCEPKPSPFPIATTAVTAP